jgi:acyl carrier protein
MKKTLKKFQKLVAKNFFMNPQTVDFSKSFSEDLRLSENEFIALIAYTENAFHIQFADNELSKFRRVRDVVKYINANG